MEKNNSELEIYMIEGGGLPVVLVVIAALLVLFLLVRFLRSKK